MITVEEALEIIKHRMPDWGDTLLPISDSVSSYTSNDLLADRDLPPFNRSTMDGIAVSWDRFQDGLREFRVAGICAAGHAQAELNDPFSCFEIMTGAPLPLGADLVIPYEDVLVDNGKARVQSTAPRVKMQFVHEKGSDARAGAVVLEKGALVNGPIVGIAASVGAALVPVKRKPRIQIVSTGDELVSVELTPLSHQIRRSNVFALKASLALHGYNDVTLAHLPDDPTEIEKHWKDNKAKYDLFIFSGAVSKGKFDCLPQAWKKMGVTEYFHGVKQSPGKPLWFGVDESCKTAVFGLPGNPVSSLVCLHRYFLSRKPVYAQLAEDFVFKKDLAYFLPVKLEFARSGAIKAHPLKIKNSGEFTALAESDGFLEMPKDPFFFAAGEVFLYHSWRPL